jgi:hypothetical protein
MSAGEGSIHIRATCLLLATCLALAGCASTGSAPTGDRVDLGTPTHSSPSVLPTIEPPETAPTATLGTTAPITLVIRSITCNDVCGPQPGTTILSDGRVIWQVEAPDGWALSERTLTPAGLEMVRGAMAATGLLETDGSYSPTVRLGMDPPGHGIISHDLRAASGDHSVVVSADDPGTFETDNTALGHVWDIPAETYVLSDLADKLSDPEAWLPEDAWANAKRPHEPDVYLIVVTAERSGELPPYVDADDVHWPLPSSIDTIGQPFTEQGTLVANSRCLPISRELAVALAAAERAVGHERSLGAPYTDFFYAWKRGPGSVDVALRPLMPDQPVTCRDGGAW